MQIIPVPSGGGDPVRQFEQKIRNLCKDRQYDEARELIVEAIMYWAESQTDQRLYRAIAKVSTLVEIDARFEKAPASKKEGGE